MSDHENTNGESNGVAPSLELENNALEDNCHLDPSYQRKSLKTDACAKAMVDIGDRDTERETRLMVLYSGGTIGMRKTRGAYEPAANYLKNTVRQMPMFHDPNYVIKSRQDIEGEVDADAQPLVMPLSNEGRRVIYTIWEYSPLLDSSNMTMTDWARLALDIKKYYHDFDGFLVLHGTDTMAYTASALSFMLENLGKPVILTGSQIPIFEARSDGRENFLGALIMAGHYCIPEVTIFFNNKLLRGNRAVKVDAGAFDAFHTPNLLPLAELEIEIKVNWDAIFRQTSLSAFQVHTNLCPHVGLLRLFPSITLSTVEAFLRAPMQGVVLQTYGAGNGPNARQDLLRAMQEACSRGVVIVNITQCQRGCVSPSYATGKALADIGIVAGLDMTPEAALTKLSYILSKNDCTIKQKRTMMKSNLCGEMRVDGTSANVTSSLIANPSQEVSSPLHDREMHKFENSFKDSLLDFPLLQKLKETMRLCSTEEVSMLKNALFPALMCAAAREDKMADLKKLQDAGAQFTQSDYDGRSALHIAASEGRTDMVRFLLEHGALVHQRDRYGNSPLDDAVRFNHHDVIAVLRRVGAHLNLLPHKLGTMLCNSAAEGDMKKLRSWHLAGANINQGDYDNRTALHVTCRQGRSDVIVLLLGMGARADIRDSFDLTALDEAKKYASSDVISRVQATLGDAVQPDSTISGVSLLGGATKFKANSMIVAVDGVSTSL